MRIKCIKLLGAYWGAFFTKGEWYSIYKTFDEPVKIITDYEKYVGAYTKWLELDGNSVVFAISSALPNIANRPLKELKQINEDYEDYEKYIKSIKLPFHYIEDNDGCVRGFCGLSRNEVKMMYGSNTFATSIHYFEDYFINQSDIRNDTIDTLIL